MRLIYASLLTSLPILTTAQSFISSSPISASQIAAALTKEYPNPSIGLLAQPYYWWQSGSTLDALLTYFHTTGDASYNSLVSNTLLSQTTGTNDFMTADATGNDDQAWWGLAAISAAEYGLPQAGPIAWIDLAKNVFNDQKGRWQTARCNGGLKWKINPADAGYTYRSTISNGLFFQLAARIARFTNDADAQAWAEKSYDWTVSVGLIDGDFNVYDGTDDSKGTGCVDVNHDQWSYNTGTFIYGAAVMAAKTGDAKWTQRTQGFITAAQRNFVKDGALFEKQCQGASGGCNTDQVSFKGTLARWMGDAAVILPVVRQSVVGILGAASNSVSGGWSAGLPIMDQFTALEVVDGLVAAGGSVAAPAVTASGAKRRSVAGRLWM